MSFEPCKNTNCNSFGKPHPNCMCYGGMAEGGDVKHFCDSNQPHHKDCQYFADGDFVTQQIPHQNSSDSIAAYLSEKGLHGLLNMGQAGQENLEQYDRHVVKGRKNIERKIDHLYRGMPTETRDTALYSHPKQQIDKWISKGGINNDIQNEIYGEPKPQNFAQGGEVLPESKGLFSNHPIQNAYPEQNMMLQTAKGRMSNYLGNLKPQKNQPKMLFDEPPDNTEQQRSYDKALHIAANPLSVLDHVQSGSIEPEHIKHLNNLHPEVGSLLEKKLNDRIAEAQFKEEKKPPYHVRQGLSLLLGAPLSGELTPSNIQAAQATFQATQQSQGQSASPVIKNKKNTSSLTKADQPFLTGNQSLIARQQKQ